MNRDFKGVWIPKEIWLNEELTLLEKIIFVEIDSLDNENHCVAGNEYFATFCNCSESKISKAIKKLKDLNMIEEVSFDGRHRKIRVVKSIIENSKKYEADSQKIRSNNIDNKQNNNKNNNSKELLLQNQNSPSFEFGKQKPKRESLYTKCVSMIDDFISQHNCGNPVRNKLIEYLKYRLSVTDKPLYTNMWKGLLAKLNKLHQEGYGYEPIIDYAIERGYLSFYPPAGCYNDIKEKPWERGVKSEGYTEEEKRQIDKEREEMEARGERVWF